MRWLRTPARRGFVLITTVLAVTVLLAFAGLALDTAYVQLVKTRMQAAADAAAVGAVQQLRMSGVSGAGTAAKADAAANGFTDGVKGITVTVNTPPSTGPYTNDPTGAEVLISQTVHSFFMELAGAGSTTVRARAVARQGSSPSCVYALDPAASGAFRASGGAVVQVNCGILVNSSSSSAMTAAGGGHVTATAAGVVGGYWLSGGGTLDPRPTTGISPVLDPLAAVPAPAVGGCTYVNKTVSGGTPTLDPGVYCNGLAISGQAQVTLRTGTYILEGGGLTISGGSSISGTGVTFYVTAGSGYGYGPVTLAGGTTLNLVAPATGPLAGILFFQDRSILGGAASSIVGGDTSVLQGALYFLTSGVTYAGGSASSYTILVAKTIQFSGNTTVRSDYSTLPNGSPAKGAAALSE